MLNSRNPFDRGYNLVLRIKNKISWSSFMDTSYENISGLKTTVGEPMHMTQKKTGFIGSLSAIKPFKTYSIH